MNSDIRPQITVTCTVHAPIDKVWQIWTLPEHIICWNTASEDWHTPRAENDLKVGGIWFSRMEAKDGSMGFDLIGKYTCIEPHRLIEYHLEDYRKVRIEFGITESGTTLKETFEAETTHPLEMQQTGWQNILNNFKKYTEQIG